MDSAPDRPKLVFDLGAHHGLDTREYLRLGYHVIALEASPAEYDIMCEVLRHVPGAGTCVGINKAITPLGDDALLYTSRCPGGETHSIFPHRVRDMEAEPVKVKGCTLQELFAEYGVPYYLKVDIEGADILAIRQLHEWASKGEARVPFLSVELDWDHPEEALEIFSHLGYMGYDHFDLVPQKYPDGKPRTASFGAQRHYDCSLSQIASRWFTYGPPSPGQWYDLHARHKSKGRLEE